MAPKCESEQYRLCISRKAERLMFTNDSTRVPGLQVIVIGNEKGGSGKTTVAMHVAIALSVAGASVAALDLDLRQKSFTRYLENRAAWARQGQHQLPIPELI